MSSPIFLLRRLFFCIKPTMKVQPSSPSSGSSSASFSLITNWGFVQKVSRKWRKCLLGTDGQSYSMPVCWIMIHIQIQIWRADWSYLDNFCSPQLTRPVSMFPQTLSLPISCIHLKEHLGWGCRSQGGNIHAGSQKMTSCRKRKTEKHFHTYCTFVCYFSLTGVNTWKLGFYFAGHRDLQSFMAESIFPQWNNFKICFFPNFLGEIYQNSPSSERLVSLSRSSSFTCLHSDDLEKTW